MTFIDAAILGLVEGLTEFLPISSTGHLILTAELLGLEHTEFLKSFEIAIQLGAILAVVLTYWRSFLQVEIVKRLMAAFIPTAVLGLILHSFVKEHLLGNPQVVVTALFFGGIALILFELLHKEKESASDEVEHISYKQAFAVGIFQAMAVVPGVSRSAATIVGGLLLGIRRVAIVEFSFLLAVPTMAAATGLDLVKSYQYFSASDVGLLATGFGVAFIVALVAIRSLLHYVKKYNFIPFGIYRILLAAFFFLVIL